MDLDNSADAFPATIDAGRGKLWTMISCRKSPDSMMGAHISDSERNIIDNHLLQAATSDAPVKNRTQLTLSEKPRVRQLWGYSQRIAFYECSVTPACKKTFVVQRKIGMLAIYSCGVHKHESDSLPKIELKLPYQLKKLLRECMSLKNSVQQAISRVSQTPIAERSAYIGDLSLGDLSKKGIRMSMDNYVKYQRAMKQKKLTCGSPLSKIGDDQSSLKLWLDKRMLAVRDLSVEVILDKDEITHELEDVIILDHDVGGNNHGKWTHITFTTRAMLQTVHEQVTACSMNHGLQFQMECDYSKGFEKNNKIQLGVVGFSDMARSFYPVVYDINVTENSIGSARAMFMCRSIIEHYGGIASRVLKDGAVALESGAMLLDLKTLRCFAHMIRDSNWTKSPKRSAGSKGSLPTYLKSKGCGKDEIAEVIIIVLAMRHLPTEGEWKEARELFITHCEVKNFKCTKIRDVWDHVLDEYFPIVPNWGPAHFPSEVHSTNGLERGWFNDKAGNRIVKQLLNCTAVKAILSTISTKSVRLTKKKVALHPPQTLEDWNAVAKCTDELPGQYRYSIYYRDGILASPQEVFARSKYPNTLTIYVPSASYIVGQESAAEKEILKAQNTAQVTNFIDNISGSGSSTRNKKVQNLIEKYICSDLNEEIPTKLNGETLIEYLKRRGQRCSNAVELSNKRREEKHARSMEKEEARKEFEKTLERDKWETQKLPNDFSATNESSASNSKLTNIEINDKPVDSKKRKRHPLEVRGLGRFCRVHLTFTGRRRGHVQCTCEVYRKQRTCDESKIFGLVFFDAIPPVHCMGHICKGWDKIGYKIGDVLKKESYCEKNLERYISNGAPKYDPWVNIVQSR